MFLTFKQVSDKKVFLPELNYINSLSKSEPQFCAHFYISTDLSEVKHCQDGHNQQTGLCELVMSKNLHIFLNCPMLNMVQLNLT